MQPNTEQPNQEASYNIPLHEVGSIFFAPSKFKKGMTSVIKIMMFLVLSFALTFSWHKAQSQTYNLNAVNKIVSINGYYAGEIPLHIIKEATELDMRPSYELISGTVYFSGTNFPNVVTESIETNSLEKLQSHIQRCGPGSVISFENIKVLKEGKVKTLAGGSFIVTPDYDQSRILRKVVLRDFDREIHLLHHY